MRRLVVVGILICVAWCAPVLAGDKVRVAEKGKTNIEATSKNLKVKATITSSPVKSEPYAPYYYLRSCIQNVEIIANGKKLFIPKSVYLDICNPLEAEIVFENKKGVLKIYGGDGSESFVVYVHFDSKLVSRRVVYSGELPDKPLEETRYWLREL
jgi:hypothetical protein